MTLSLQMSDTENNTVANNIDRMRVLLVDDDSKYCRLISNFLTKYGYDVTSVHEGSAAVQLARGGSWNAIVLDVMLPGIDGYEVLRKIRENSQVPVLMLTALGVDETDRIVGLEMGADDYLPKSFSPRELLARLRAVLRRTVRGVTESRELKVAQLSINASNRSATMAGELLILTPIEFDLLLGLAQSKGRLMTREQLLNALGDRSFDTSDRSIDVHISSLRRKLHDDPKNPRYIRTIRAAGYILTEPEDTVE